jgi:sugar/nucleoside kinase (ribokinase family)
VEEAIIAFGDVNVDMVTTLPGFKASGAAVAPETSLFPGGTVGNTAAGLARGGCPVRFFGKVGNDAFGRFIREDFIREGVDVSHLMVEPQGFTVIILAFIDSAGERHITVWPPRDGAHTQMKTADLDESLWSGAGWFHTSGISLRQEPTASTTLEAMARAKERGIPISFDMNSRIEFFGWTREDQKKFLKAADLCDYLLGSLEDELIPLAEAQSGFLPGDSAAEKALSCLDLLGKNQRVVVGRRGGAGTVLYKDHTLDIVPAYEVEITDALGAGDAFNSGFIQALWRGSSPKEAVARGNGSAALNLTRAGARGTPTGNELDAFLSNLERPLLPVLPLD